MTTCAPLPLKVPSDSPKESPTLVGRWKKEGSFVPLFLKLQDMALEEVEENPPFKIFSKEDLQRSIITEISHLLNTRITIPSSLFDKMLEQPSFYGYPELYGLPDFSYFDATNKATWTHYAFLIKTAIAYYETRLHNISVTIEKFEPLSQTLQASIQGDLLFNEMIEPFSFSIVLSKPSS